MKILRIVVLCVALSTMVGCPEGGGGGGGSDSLLGTWHQILPFGMPDLFDNTYTFEDDVTFSAAVTWPDGSVSSWSVGTYTINTDTTPAQMDMTTTEFNGETLEGTTPIRYIYEIANGELRMATDLSSEAPSSFAQALVEIRYNRNPSKAQTAELLDALISGLGGGE